MNQILSTENFNNKGSNNRKTKDINTIVKFFAIILIVFGIFLLASSAYAMYKGQNTSTEKSIKKPEIQLENKGEDQVILKVMHTEEISQVSYYWNDEEPETLKGNGRKYIESVLDIPKGDNTLTVKASDVNGQDVEYTRRYTLESNINIKFEQSGNNVKVNVTSNDEIDNITYKWDDGQEEEEEGKGTEQSFDVEVLLGVHELVVKVVDVNGIEEEKKITVEGATKPTVKLSKGEDGDSYVIKAHDDIGLNRIEIVTLEDGEVKTIKTDDKDFEYNFPLKENDDNLIKVTAYNSKGVQSDSVKVKCKK